MFEENRKTLVCSCCLGEGVDFAELGGYLYASVFSPVDSHSYTIREMKKLSRKGQTVFDIVLTPEMAKDFKEWLSSLSLEENKSDDGYRIEFEHVNDIDVYFLSIYADKKGIKKLGDMTFGSAEVKEWIKEISANE